MAISEPCFADSSTLDTMSHLVCRNWLWNHQYLIFLDHQPLVVSFRKEIVTITMKNIGCKHIASLNIATTLNFGTLPIVLHLHTRPNVNSLHEPGLSGPVGKQWPRLPDNDGTGACYNKWSCNRSRNKGEV